MEPQYNPGVEQQAIDRVHRLGQKREVEIVHFIMKESVEEALLRLQDKKTKLAKLSMDKKKTKSEEAKKRMEELRELFK
jgi:SNF2 family DNA or RNA helicase